MAFKLSKSEAAERALLVDQLTEAKTEMTEAIEAFNAKMEQEWQEVREKIDEYNEKLSEAAEFRDNIVQAKQDEWDGRSEKWQDGERGSAAGDWIREWETANFDELDIANPEPIDVPDTDADEDLGSLPDAMEDPG